MAVARNGGAVVIEEDQLVDEKLADEILKLKNNPEVLRDMAEKSAACAPVHAAEMICDTIFGKMTE
jgi:UDP-N-acetylglucosamine:LPS N-acetylglucosamine transferase